MEYNCTEDKFKLKVSTKIKRYYRWKYSGPVTVITCCLVAVLVWYGITSNIEFYDKFTCPQMMEYYNGDYGVMGEPRYSDLTEEQKQKYSVEYQRCVEMGWHPDTDP